LGGTTDVQLCHNSVVQRGSAVTANIVPLNCKTHYLCISANNECEDARMPNPDDVVTVKSEDEIYHALAEEMADCWWMYGEGKIDYLGEADVTKNLYCSVCSSVIFDKSVSQKIGTPLNQFQLKSYLTNNYMPNTEKTYLQYLYNNPTIPKGTLAEDPSAPSTPDPIDLTKSYYIATARSGKATWVDMTVGAIVTVGGVVGGIVLIVGTGGIATPIGVSLIAGGIGVGAGVGHLIGTLIENEGYTILSPNFIPQDFFKELKCADVKSLS